MDPCECWAIALERARRGDLPPEEKRALEEHLATCPACSAARAEAELLDAALSVPPPPADWPGLEARLHRAQRAYGQDVRLAARAAGVALISFWFIRGLANGHFYDSFSAGLFTGGVVALLFMAATYLWSRRRERQLGVGGDLFENLRRRYRRRIFVVRWVTPWYPLFALLLIPVRRVLAPGHGWLWVVVSAGVGFAGLALWARRKLLPRLKRELAELEGAA